MTNRFSYIATQSMMTHSQTPGLPNTVGETLDWGPAAPQKPGITPAPAPGTRHRTVPTQHGGAGAQHALLPQAPNQLVTGQRGAATVSSGQGLLQLQQGALHAACRAGHDAQPRPAESAPAAPPEM